MHFIPIEIFHVESFGNGNNKKQARAHTLTDGVDFDAHMKTDNKNTLSSHLRPIRISQPECTESTQAIKHSRNNETKRENLSLKKSKNEKQNKNQMS